EHGFIGLFLYLLLMGQTWFFAGWVIRNARNEPDGAWMIFLARMLQVSQIGFLVGGTFLSLSYWDMPFYQTVVIVAMRRLLKERQATAARSKANGEKIGAQLGEPIGEPRSEPMTVPVLEPKA
ncbi:MAG TPA: hypothetical protein VFW00_13495, partial [Rhodocyclaceae bacterium]|nr:hypothetical protein [Rhodocyclaceae bacterium]